MSLRIRGQEATVQVAVDGVQAAGSFFKVKDFRSTPRNEIKEDDYIGELESDLDFQHHGFDLAFSVDNQDSAALDYLSTIIAREESHTAHPVVNITVIYRYREGGAPSKTEVYQNVFLRTTEQNIGGRKEYVSTGFEGKCKKRRVLG